MLASQYNVVSGVVKNHHPGSSERGNTLESFEVNDVRFSYYPLTGSPEFNQTNAFGGPIKNGLHVKIYYIDGKILKLIIFT